MSTAKIDKHALAKRFLQLGKPEQIKFIELLDAKGLDFEKLPIVAGETSAEASLSPAQKRLWDIYCLDKGNSAYHMSGAFSVCGQLDVVKLTSYVNQVLQRHHVLRTRFITTEQDGVVQFVDSALTLSLEVVDARTWTKEHQSDAQNQFVAQAFDLELDLPIRMQCLQIEESSWVLQIVMHHIVSDGWSIGVFLNELISLYQDAALSELPIQYGDYSNWQKALLDAGKGQQHIDFWQEELGCEQSEALYPWSADVAPNQRRVAKAINYQLDSARSEKLKQVARQLSITTSSLWLGLWQAALAKTTGRTDISVGVPMANRTRQEVASLIGFFVNTMVIKQSLNPATTLSVAIENAHNKVMAAQEHQLLPFDQLVSALVTERKAGETPLFQVLFNHQNVLSDNVELGGALTLSPQAQDGQFALFDVALDVRESQNKTEVVLTYASDRICEASMIELNATLECLVDGVDSYLQQPIVQINTLSKQDSLLLNRLSQPEGKWAFQSVMELISRHACERPNAVALKHQNKEYTYLEVDTASTNLAQQLVELGATRDKATGVLFERSAEMFIVMIAVMKAGGAFLPLDPDYPTERLAYMIQDSGADLVISQQGLTERWNAIHSEFDCSSNQAELVVLEPKLLETNTLPRLETKVLPEQLAYIIYTSGSTGKPKGVAVNHVGLSMHIQTIGQQYGMAPSDVELHFASISFDGAVERWTVPLAFGSKLVIRDQALWSAEKTCEVLQQENVTIACFPPSYVGPLLDWIEHTDIRLNVRSWTLGGEAFTAETYQRLQNVVNPPRIINGYGPTETVVTPMIWRAYPEDKLESAYAPIGNPVGERRLYILNAQLNQVAFGEVGELYIGGEVGLARGYLGQPHLTSERFIPDPFTQNGERMYRTGDLVRWNQNQVMEYMGRADQQVKIRGFRVELGEIESQLQAVTQVEHCVVAAKEVGNQKQLFGYLQSAQEQAFDFKAILATLSQTLPDYMVPSQLMVMEKLPLTPAGKIDRNALPTVSNPLVAQSEVVAPQTEQEKLLASIWQELLGINQVGCGDNFFTLGGDSILCLQMVSKVRVAGYNITPQQVFSAKTLSELAVALDVHKATKERIETSQPFGLMPIQAHFFAQEFPEPDYWNQHVCVELKQSMNVEYLEAAIQALVKLHPSLRLAFDFSDGQWKQRFTPFESRTYLWRTESLTESEFSAFAQEIHQSMDIRSGRLIQAGYAQMASGNSRLMITIHHLAVDGVSWRILLDDLWKAYQQVASGQSINLMPISASLDEAVNAIEKWCEGPDGKLMQDTWHESSVSNQKIEPARYRDKQTFESELSNQQTQQLLRDATVNLGVDTQTILISALVSALGSADEKNVPVYLEGHGREPSVFADVDLSRMVGWTTSLYPMIGHYQADELAVLSSTAQYLGQVKRDGGIGYGSRYLDDGVIEECQAQATFNYLGQYSSNSFAHWCAPIENGGLPQSGLNKMLTPLVINAQIVSGRLTIAWEYATTHYSANSIQNLAEKYTASLIQLINATPQPKAIVADAQLVEKLNDTPNERQPVFCIHPVTGRVTGYQKLAQALDGKCAVFGIKSKSFAYDNVFDSSFSEMADVYYQTIKQLQPQGPYRLVGWSLGGALVQELIKRFENNGDEVAFGGLLDCYVPGTEIAEDQWESPASKAKLLEHLSMLLGELSESQSQRCLQLLDSVNPPMWPSAFVTWLSENQFDQYMASNAQQMLFSWSVEQHMRALCDGYALPKVNTALHCWWAGKPLERNEWLSGELSKLNSLKTSVVVDTDHLGIVQSDRVITDLVKYLVNQ